MAIDDKDLDDLALAISDRTDIDWVAREQTTSGSEGRRLLAQLKLVEAIARLHAETAGDPADAEESADAGTQEQDFGTWGDLQLKEVIGRGAFGTVYRAYDPKLARFVAAKLWPEGGPGDDSAGAIQEGRLLARVRHPHVVTVFGADRKNGQVGIWMELVAGRTLESIVRAHGPFNAREAALIGIDLCNALSAVHRVGLLHRDVKAQNVMRETGGRLVLMDLGAGLELPRDDESPVDTAGTPMYMAPELFTGGRPSVQGDIYSVGMLLFRLVTGGHALEADTVRDLRAAISAKRRRRLRELRPDLPVPFEQVVEGALAFDPLDRYQSAAEMEYALMSAIGLTASVNGRTDPTTGRGRLGRVVSSRLPAWAAVLLVAGAIAATAVATDLFKAGEPETRPASSISSPGATPPPGSPVPLSEDERRIWSGYEELAASHMVQGHWAEAVSLYSAMYAIFYRKWGPDAPMIGYSMSRESWATFLAGDHATALEKFDMALYKLEQEVGADHPYVLTTLMAKAVLLQSQKREADAAIELARALARRARLMRRLSENGTQASVPPEMPAERWVPILRSHQIGADADADWIPDAIEIAIGTNPSKGDTDGDGTVDGEEDSNGDGWPNCADYCQGWDPTRIVAHLGAVDPIRLAFASVRPFEYGPSGVPGGVPGWNVTTTTQGYYVWPIPAAYRKLAFERGWRFLSAGELREGTAWVSLDFASAFGRWDVGLEAASGIPLQARVVTRVLPLEGPTVDLGRSNTWPLLGFDYDPTRSEGRLLVGWRTALTGIRAHQQFLEDQGMGFGAHNSMGRVARGVADFFYVSFEIR